MTTVKKVDVMSAAKIMGCIYLILALIFDVFVLIGILYSVASKAESGVIGMQFGILIGVPVFYGIIGFIGGAIMSSLYNLAASKIGGIKIELENK